MRHAHRLIIGEVSGAVAGHAGVVKMGEDSGVAL